MSTDNSGDGQHRGENFTNKAPSTFHTPSFGDDDFDLPPLSLPVEQDSVSSGDVGQQPFSHQMLSSLDLGLKATLSSASSMQTTDCSASSLRGINPVVPKFPPQNFDVPDINVTNSVMSNASGNIFSSIAASTGTLFDNVIPNQLHQTLSTISQTQMANQLGFSTALHGTSPVHVTSPPASNSTSSPSRESSEDSDDSLPLAKLMSLKRAAASTTLQSPLSAMAVTTVSSPLQQLVTIAPKTTSAPITTASAKRQKTPKKKKKKDPNEPQKPVSAYALFFRDTQAAIKGQSPNKTFGDVSKIVASMWDSLDLDNKNVYKKKTEVAKKEYLKQLAAYRASQVSQTVVDDVNFRTEESPSPIHIQLDSAPQSGGNSMGMMSQMNLPSPPQPITSTSPPHQPMQQLQNIPHHNNGMTYHAQNIVHMDTQMGSNGLCVRNGCSNQAIDNAGWDSEYCSNECVVSHCRDIFTAWVASKQCGSTFPVK